MSYIDWYAGTPGQQQPKSTEAAKQRPFSARNKAKELGTYMHAELIVRMHAGVCTVFTVSRKHMSRHLKDTRVNVPAEA